jgi:hypothetical protein
MNITILSHKVAILLKSLNYSIRPKLLVVLDFLGVQFSLCILYLDT